MKRLIFSIAILLSFVTCFSQANDVRAKRVIVDQSLFIGLSGSYGRWVDTIYNDTTNLNGYVRSVPTNNAVYDFVQGRHNALNTAINLRLLKTDTTAMLSVYVRRQELKDTAAAIRASGLGVTDGDKGDITIASGVYSIDADVVTYGKMQNVTATNRFMGRYSSGSGNMEEMTPTVATSLLDVFTTSLKGLAPASGGGTTNFLRADGTWAAPPGGGGGGTYTSSNLGGGLSNYSTQVGNDFRFNTFNTNDFNLSSNLIAIDYANGQKVSSSVDGFATSAQLTRWDSVTYFRNTGATGVSLLLQITENLLGIKKLIAGTNITIDDDDSSATINSTGGGGGGRFGFATEDDEAAESRDFDMNNFDILIHGEGEGGRFEIERHRDGTGDYKTKFYINDNFVHLESEQVGQLSTLDLYGFYIKFHQASGQYIFDTPMTPASSSAEGETGQWAWDEDYFYICIAPDTWQRVAHATW